MSRSVQLTGEQLYALEMARQADDSVDKATWYKIVGEIERLNKDEESPKKESWISKIDPNTIIVGVFSVVQMVMLFSLEHDGVFVSRNIWDVIHRK